MTFGHIKITPLHFIVVDCFRLLQCTPPLGQDEDRGGDGSSGQGERRHHDPQHHRRAVRGDQAGHRAAAERTQAAAQVSWDWWRAGHVTAVLTSDWSSCAADVKQLRGGDPVDSWYKEIKEYKFGVTTPTNMGTGHFSQVMGKKTFLFLQKYF